MPDPARLALTPICFHLQANGSKSHTEVTSSLLPASVPRAEDAGDGQRECFKDQLMDREGRVLTSCFGCARLGSRKGPWDSAWLQDLYGSEGALGFMSTTGGCAGQGDPLC